MTDFQRRRFALSGESNRSNDIWVALKFVVAGMVLPLAAIAALVIGRVS